MNRESPLIMLISLPVVIGAVAVAILRVKHALGNAE
jgi:hypothetical protein